MATGDPIEYMGISRWCACGGWHCGRGLWQPPPTITFTTTCGGGDEDPARIATIIAAMSLAQLNELRKQLAARNIVAVFDYREPS